MSILEVDDLHVRLSGAYIIQGISLRVPSGSAVALLGHNGAGKTTLVRAIMGLTGAIEAGRIRWDGADLTAKPPWTRPHRGLCYVPQSRRLFRSLTVEEHLAIAEQPPRPGVRAWTRADLFALFPNLERRRNQRSGLSGGEQQMLAIARALIANPRTIILDEPTEGLAPALVKRLVDVMHELKAEGIGIFLVEQDYRIAADIADTVCIQQSGQIVFQGEALDAAAIGHTVERMLALRTDKNA
jgi:branched-chain amino acid transport system ATP-binding protein